MSKKPSALITGIAGQDGSYLAELLVAKGYRVIGAVRDPDKAAVLLPRNIQTAVELVAWDMLDQRLMIKTLRDYQPQEFYNFAACSSGVRMYDDPVSISEVNGVSVTRMLEAIRTADVYIRFCQASSREIFGDGLESPQNELTPMCPRSPYGAAKLYADNMIRIYRERYDLFACSAILFNHESPRRGLEFVTRKITSEVAKIKCGLTKELRLGNLNAYRDWGFAGDYVRGMWLMLQQEHPSDYVFATGKAHTVRELCEIAFSHLGLDYRDYVREEVESYRPAESALLVGDISKARIKLNWHPETGFKELVKMMVDEDLRKLIDES